MEKSFKPITSFVLKMTFFFLKITSFSLFFLSNIRYV